MNEPKDTTLLYPSDEIIAYMKNKIGFSSEVYIDSAGYEVIGYGSMNYEDGSRVHLGDEPINEEYAELLFQLTLLYHADTIDKYISVKLLQHQYDALISFASTVVRASFGHSRLCRLINEDTENMDIAIAFIKWNKINERFDRKIALRRQEEANIYFYGEY